mgnify:CR=1 FL=1|jgi:hypothetical protein
MQQQIDWKILEALKDSIELYRFVTSRDEDYNDFIEMLDDDSNITSDTLGLMNQISVYFKKLKEALSKFDGSFAQILGFLSCEIKSETIINESFLVQLDACN